MLGHVSNNVTIKRQPKFLEDENLSSHPQEMCRI